jgi:hypothetical protein
VRITPHSAACPLQCLVMYLNNGVIMKLSFRVKNKSTGQFTEDYDAMMDKSDLDSRMGFEDIGIQSDGTPVIFDKCGSFGYLSNEFELVVMSDT